MTEIRPTDSVFMRSRLFDPDAIREKVYSPTYVVEFWKPGQGESWRLTDAMDVASVVLWARDRSLGRNFVIYAEHSQPDGVTLHRIYDGVHQAEGE